MVGDPSASGDPLSTGPLSTGPTSGAANGCVGADHSPPTTKHRSRRGLAHACLSGRRIELNRLLSMVSVMAGRRMRIRTFTTCPQTKDVAAADYAERVAEVARWSESGGCQGILVYTDNGIADPWLVSQLIIQSTHALSPLVAVQPVYMSPYAAAKMVATLGYLHGRRVDLNMVAGGFRNDLLSLSDDTAHDDRYERLVEYAQVVRGLLTSSEPFSFEGTYYRLVKARLRPSLDERLLPGFLVSGSSPAGMAAAGALGATAVKYPQPAQQEAPDPGAVVAAGIRVGVISRPTDSEAWEVAHDRFPAGPSGTIDARRRDERFRLRMAPPTVESARRRGYERRHVLAMAISELPDILPLPGRKPRPRCQRVAHLSRARLQNVHPRHSPVAR